MAGFEHEQVVVRTGARSGLPVIVAIHSTVPGQAVGGLRLWRYADWRDGLADALRLSAGMTAKCALAGMANGGGKTVVPLPAGIELDADLRGRLLEDIAEVINSLDGLYATGPDVGTSPADMAALGEYTRHVFCKPPEQGGSGDSSPHTAAGVMAALRAVSRRIDRRPGLSTAASALRGRRLAIVGLGSVGGKLARLLAAEGADLVVSDVDPGKRALADEVGAQWVGPGEALTAEADIVVPAALGGVLTEEIVPRLRCAAIAGPANNQLATPEVAGLLHRRGIVWVPDYVASAGGVIYALTRELHQGTDAQARRRVEEIEDTVLDLLDSAARRGITPAQTADELARHRLARI